MLERHKLIEVNDPHDTMEAIWNALPNGERVLLNYQNSRFRRYAPLHYRTYAVDPASYRSSYAIARLGSIRVSNITDRRGTSCEIERPMDSYALYFVLHGSGGIVQSKRLEAADPNTGLIASGVEQTRFMSSDGSERLTLWLPASRLRRCLEALLGCRVSHDLTFSPKIDLTRGGGGSLYRLALYIGQELSHSDSLLANQIGADLLDDLLCRSLLCGVQHNYSERLNTSPGTVGVRGLRRAEEYMRAHVGDRVTLADIARAAGCSVRSLQAAFRQARDTTPMAFLRRTRLEAARRDFLHNPAETVTTVASKYGFSNPGRFAKTYREVFGEPPLTTRRLR